MTDKEKLIKEIMAECEKDGEPITREEAEEMAEMEIKAGAIKNYTQAETTKKAKAPKERKIDEEKLQLLQWVERGLYEFGEIHTTRENEVKLHFEYNGSQYSITLTKHRAKKG